MPDLRETVARVAFETEVGYAPDDRAWERAGEYWLGFADKILAIPELTRPTADLGEDGDLIERLRVHARCASDVHRLMAEAKTERQVDGGSYGWIAPEQTDEWQAADRLILYGEALADAQEQVGAYGYSTVHGRRVRQSWAAELLDKIDAVLSRSGDYAYCKHSAE